MLSILWKAWLFLFIGELRNADALLCGSSDDAIGAVGVLLASIQIAVLLFSIFPTEAALKRTFGEDGTRKRIP